MSKKNITIAIDWVVASGKWATAQWVAKALDYIYLDTGASYRAIAWYVLNRSILPTDIEAIVACLPDIHIEMKAQLDDTHIYVNGEDVTTYLRSMEINECVALIAKIPEVREKLRKIQKEIAKNGWVVMDGRDMGTHVVPNAELKVFMLCDTLVRAKRRQLQLLEKQGEQVSIENIVANITQRDNEDYFGKNATSHRAPDARELDTTNLTLQNQIDIILQRVNEIS